MELEIFQLALLRRPSDPTGYDDETLDSIQRQHLEYHQRLRAEERVVTNGPVSDQSDDSLRGLSFYRCGSVQEARALAEADPAVVAGRLEVEVVTWWCPPGTMVLPGTPLTIDD
jgi:uncharacterized protein YciI